MGDLLLCQAAAHIQQCAGPQALVARQGGDECPAVLRTGDAARAQAIIQALAAPFEIGPVSACVGASVGLAFAPPDAHTHDELLRCADAARYAAKAGGGQPPSPAMDADYARRAQRLAELHGAAERGEFVLHYQPPVRPHDSASPRPRH